MKEYTLKYGCDPGHAPARIFAEGDGELPIEVLNGEPGYVNFLDALNAWQLVRELKTALRLPAAASFQCGGPSSAAVGIPMSAPLKDSCFVDDIEGLDSSPLACAYARARGSDRLSAYGDWVALSDVCDETTARLLEREVSDGVIAPGFDKKALEILKGKRNGAYKIVRVDPAYEPEEREYRQVFGVAFEQQRSNSAIHSELLNNIVTTNKEFPASAARDLLLTLITLKYAQPNAVCCAIGGQTIGIGAGQRSQIHGTRLACDKANNWFLRMSPKVLALPFWKDISRPLRDKVIDSYINRDEMDVCSDGLWPRFFSRQPEPFPREEQLAILRNSDNVALGSSGFFAFPDNIERAHRSGVCYIAQPGGSVHDEEIVAACNRHNMVMVLTDTNR